MVGSRRQVRKVPDPESLPLIRSPYRTQHEVSRDFMPHCFRSPEVDHQLKPGRLLDRNVNRLRAAQHLDDHPRLLAKDFRHAGP